MTFDDVECGDLIEYKAPLAKKRHGIYLGVHRVDDAGIAFIMTIAEPGQSLPSDYIEGFSVDILDQIEVEIRSSMQDVEG